MAADGSIAVNPLDAQSSSLPYKHDPKGMSFTGVRWTMQHCFVTGKLDGSLDVWDSRQQGKKAPVLELKGTAANAQPITCMDVHAAQPFMCCSGDMGGGVNIWDLRSAAHPTATCSVGARVTALQYDSTGDRTVLATQPIAWSSADGRVGFINQDAASGGLRLGVLYQEPAGAMRGLCLLSCGPHQQMFSLSSQETIAFMTRTAASLM